MAKTWTERAMTAIKVEQERAQAAEKAARAAGRFNNADRIYERRCDLVRIARRLQERAAR